ncbi:coiled-coil domain-containing protein 8 isoform X2 [Sorex fumeus]|uniref:coiled-coil domain-containing protein 8 isoform X2 n=1 Tax=Sorex fumeus TaxID=62283 RepID=UPI0024ADF48B|nr:coiled-coil domain-containing protein 8 isoform X2 [Sorex fumeus]
MLQIGEDVDYLRIPREVLLAGGVWRVISKPATKEAEFRERLTQFLEEEGRTLEDVARIIEKSTPHPPQPPAKSKAPRVRRRVPQMAIPPPRLVVGTYDSSNASDSDLSDFETSRPAGGRARARRMPVSYLGSKYLGSDVESGDDEELVDAFLRRGEQPAGALQPLRRRLAVPVPTVDDNPGPQLTKADRWRECVRQVSWGKLRQRVKGWAPRAGPGSGEVQPALAVEQSAEAPAAEGASGGDDVGSGLDAQGPVGTPRKQWKPKINWASLRRRHSRKEVADFPADQIPGAADNQRAQAPAVQGVLASVSQRPEALASQREAVILQRADLPHSRRAEAPLVEGAGAALSGMQAPDVHDAARGASGATSGARARKQVKTVRFQTPGRFSWFRKRRRALWASPRLPTLPKREPRAGEASSLRALRAQARAEAGLGEHEEQL